jgi:hypothetical protein
MKFIITALVGSLALVGAIASAQTPYDVYPSGDDVTVEHIDVIRNEAAIVGGAIGLETAGCGDTRRDYVDSVVVFMDTWNSKYGTGNSDDVIPALIEFSTPMAGFFLELAATQGCTVAVGAYMQMDVLIEAEGAESPTVSLGLVAPSITGSVMSYFTPRFI